jgi:hypothetical protein
MKTLGPKGLRARMRIFYWHNDRFRRTVNWTRQNWYVILGFMMGVAISDMIIDRAQEQAAEDRRNSTALYLEAMDRNSKLNDQLREALQEQSTLRQELRGCREKQ